jgi:hypothetical protein
MLVHRVGRALACAVLIVLSTAASAKDTARKGSRPAEAQGTESAVIVVRAMKDGDSCLGTVRLRPLRGGQIDRSRFVDIGHVTSFESKPQLQAMGEFFWKGLTLDISGLMAEVKNDLKDWFMPIAPGSYVMTSIRCRQGNRIASMGSDHANLFAAESGFSNPIKGANVIDVRPGEILHAGVLEIRSDEVGFFQPRTASVVALPAPDEDQARLRELFPTAGKRLRFTTFRVGVQ